MKEERCHGILLLSLLVMSTAGCAAFRPLKGIPATALPDDFRLPARSQQQTIDLSLLRRSHPGAHRVDGGDLLSIYIEGVLGQQAEQLPVYYPPRDDLPPTVGYPVPVREDGTISLPYVGTLLVRGMTLSEVEQRIRQAYTQDRQILQPGRDRLLVGLQRPRSYRVTVFRQEAGAEAPVGFGGALNLGALKRGTGRVVTLPVYRNDVLNALAETGGLPGLDAENAIYVIRSGRVTSHTSQHHFPRQGFSTPALTTGGDALSAGASDEVVVRGQSPAFGTSFTDLGGLRNWSAPHVGAGLPWRINAPPPETASIGISPFQSTPEPEAWQPLMPGELPPQFDPGASQRRIIRIPIRLAPGETIQLREEDITLYDGDIVFIESRETEVFYTGGLLGGGQYTLPRDYDLDILQAIAVAQGQRVGGGSPATSSIGGPSALNNDVSISASQVVILRNLPEGGILPIQVDLYEALRNPAARVIIQPGDYILLQYTTLEAIAAFVERHLLAGAIFGVAAAQFQNGGR